MHSSITPTGHSRRTLVRRLGVVVLAASAAATLWALPGFAGSSSPSDYVPVTPCRLIDTRAASQVGPFGSPIGEGASITVTGRGDSGECDLPADASALMVNATAVGATARTHLTIWPSDDEMPLASSLNPAPGQPPVPNAVATSLSADGKFDMFNRFGNVDVVVDVTGYCQGIDMSVCGEGNITPAD